MDSPADKPPVALFKKRTAKTNLRKRPATPPPASSTSEYSSEDESGQRIKRRRKVGVAAGSTLTQRAPRDSESFSGTTFVGDRSSNIEISNDATKQSNWYDENAPDALSAKNLLGSTRKKDVDGEEVENDGTYKGQSNYQSFIQKKPNARQIVGPMKSSTNVRMVTVTDFAPDVCKDYKQTGFCGFGDSCKFLHARENYKQGWALDKEWEIQTKGKKLKGTVMSSANRDTKDDDGDEEEAALLEKIPFACIICKESYKNPVVTKCGHYYCEACALRKYKKNPNCVACGAGTNGVFNVARNLRKLLDRKRKREERLKEKEMLENASDSEP